MRISMYLYKPEEELSWTELRYNGKTVWGYLIYRTFGDKTKILQSISKKRAGVYDAKKIVAELHPVSRSLRSGVLTEKLDVYYPVASLIEHLELINKEHPWKDGHLLRANGCSFDKVLLVID